MFLHQPKFEYKEGMCLTQKEKEQWLLKNDRLIIKVVNNFVKQSKEFVNATFVDAEINGDNVALLTDTGDLWVCGVVAGLEDVTEPTGFHKVATDVKSFDFQDMVLSIVKTDSSLWATKDLNTYDGPKDGFHKIMDNVRQVSNSGASGLALDYNGDVWAWIGEMAIFNFPVNVEDIPASYKKTSSWGVSVVKPYKVMSDVKKCLYVGSNGYFLKNDGTLLSTGSNSSGTIGNGEKSKEYFNVNPYEVMFQFGMLQNFCLLPVVMYPCNVVSEASRRAYRHQVCDMWLNRLLGTPSWKTRDVTIYNYWWGRISSIAYENDDLLNRGGSISIQYYDGKKE